jgi:hypothetical protein
MNLIICLKLAAGMQLALVIVNIFIEKLLGWKPDIERMPLLIREVFRVHCWFISVTLAIFGIVTLRFAEELAAGSNELGAWLAIGIALFWAIRAVIQVSYYSSTHWRGLPDKTFAHVMFLLAYSGFAVVYGLAGWTGVAP